MNALNGYQPPSPEAIMEQTVLPEQAGLHRIVVFAAVQDARPRAARLVESDTRYRRALITRRTKPHVKLH
jgi:hypothetical protein